jgi:hypothetical protein
MCGTQSELSTFEMYSQLTTREVEICRLAGVSLEDAAFLKSLTGKPIELLEIPNYNDYPNRADLPAFIGIHSYAAYGQADKIVLDYFDLFQEQGKTLFRGDTLYLFEKKLCKEDCQQKQQSKSQSV